MKIVLVGAGSAVFGKRLIADILWHEALADAEIVLVDIDLLRLETALGMALSINRSLGARGTIRAEADRRRALAGADIVICTIGVGGMAATRDDLEIPRQFGLRQTVGDTLGVGGIFRALRGVPELLRLCADIEELCPDAWLINYSNPMAMHCLAVQRATRVKSVGICHGVQNTAQTWRMIAAMLDTPADEIAIHFARPYDDPIRIGEWQAWLAKGDDPRLDYTCAGINHMAFFLRFTSAGEDLYPKLFQALEIPHIVRLDPVRFELMRWLGYFMTETSGHTAEYTPYFLKSDEEIAHRFLMVSGYLHACEKLTDEFVELRRKVLAGEPIIDIPYRVSNEYAGRIINALATGQPFVFNGNVHNRGGALIANLPGDCCVEVPCVATRAGIAPTVIGDLPPQCAALIRTNVNVQDLTVRGILDGNKQAIYQALMLDPNTAATLTLPQIRTLGDAMFAAHRERLPANLR